MQLDREPSCSISHAQVHLNYAFRRPSLRFAMHLSPKGLNINNSRAFALSRRGILMHDGVVGREPSSSIDCEQEE